MEVSHSKKRIVETVFFITVGLYFLVSIYFGLNRTAGSGDELLFIRDLSLIKESGWIVAIEKGISIPYMLLAYPFSLVMKSHIALRLVNVLILTSLFYYFSRRIKTKRTFYGFLLFYISTAIFFFIGTNDTLFFVTFTVFVSETFFLVENKKWNSSLAYTTLIVSFFTRTLFLIYIPVVLICFYCIYKYAERKSFNWKPLLLFLVLLGLNTPSILANNKLSYDLKSPPELVKSNWAQRQYLAQLMVNKGELKNHGHPTWEQTDAYLLKNGSDSLPNSILSGLLFSPKLTLIEFFKDVFDCLLYGTRQLGSMLAIVILFGIAFFIKNKKKIELIFIPISLLIMICIFSLIIISYVELRWLAPVFIASILYYWNLQHNNKISNTVVLINYLVLTTISCYGIYTKINDFL